LYGTFASRLREVAVSHLAPGMRCFDLGTGSGFLACALARGGGYVDACDLDLRSCAMALSNARINGVDVAVVNAESLSAISTRSTYDLMVANLPFCRAPLLEEFSKSMYHRCFSAPEGLVTEVVEGALQRLRPGGKLMFCYASSGWLEELDRLYLQNVRTFSIHVHEQSTCEVRWVVRITKSSKSSESMS
jgi:methylase of polypeptide subunit release factors